MAFLLWLAPAIAAGRLGAGRLGAGYPAAARRDDAAGWSQEDWDASARQYTPSMSFAFGSAPEEPADLPGPVVQSSDGLEVQSQTEQSFASVDLTATTGLAFQGYLPAGLVPCATLTQHVAEGARLAELPNALPVACYRAVVDENVHTLAVVALPAATTEAPETQTKSRHTFAISVPAVAADKTKVMYDASSGAFSVKLVPAGDILGADPVSFAQVAEDALMVHRFVTDQHLGYPSSAPRAQVKLEAGMREIRGG